MNGNGLGACVLYNTYRETYASGIVLTAIAASGTPARLVDVATSTVNGWAFADVAQDMVDFLAFGQVEYPVPNILYEGGWEYFHMDNGAYGTGWMGDQSNSGYAVLGLAEAEAFGSTIPNWVKTELNVWIDWVQDDVNGDATDGGSWYSYPGDYIGVNILKTGNLLTQMALCGDSPDDQRVMDAVQYMVNHWYDAAGINGVGWNANYQAMFCLMKGLVFMGIDIIGTIDWFADVATVIVSQQDASGAWLTSQGRGEPVIITEWALLTLEKIAPPPPVVMVDFDIHPTSWPNPINTKSLGLTPTAILGTEDFDVTTIDPATLYLDLPAGMVYPVTWAYEDVTMPVDNGWECNDTEMGPDGFMDLTVKFNTQELVMALGEVNDGDFIIIPIKGNLMDDGQDIFGDDCIVIINKGKDARTDLTGSLLLGQNRPNPCRNDTYIMFALPSDSHVSLEVFDVLGNRVMNVAEGQYPAGSHGVQLDVTGLESGYYFYRLISGNGTATKRMLVLD